MTKTTVEKDASPEQIRQARRLLDLKVKEVSVVDRPAIQREFLIVKRVEDSSMSNKIDMAGVSARLVKSLTAHGFKLEKLEKQLPPELKAAVEAVVPWMAKMADQAEGDVKEAIAMVAAYLSTLEEGAMPTQQRDEGAKDKAAPPADAAKKPNPDEPVKQKAMSLDDDTSTVVKVDNDGNVHVISKGKKKSDPVDPSALSEASKTILSLLKDADAATFKATMEAIMSKELGSNAKLDSKVRPEGEGKVESMKKNDDEFAEIKKRLDAIEKQRGGSTAITDDGGSDKKPEIKKSFWSGVLSGGSR